MTKTKQAVIAVRFASRITLKNGRVLYARNYGLKAFPIKVRIKQ